MHWAVLIVCAHDHAVRHHNAVYQLYLSLSWCASMPDLTMSHNDWPTMQVTVVCLVALTSGKMHCLLDAKHCKESGEGRRGSGTVAACRRTPWRSRSPRPFIEPHRTGELPNYSAYGYALAQIWTVYARVMLFSCALAVL